MISKTQFKTGIAALVGSAALIATSMSVASAQAPESTEENGYVCLERSGTGPGGSTQVTKVMALASKETLLSGRGFRRTNCAAAKKWLRTAGPSMCALADINDAAFLSQFLNMHGLRPSEICELLNELPGQA